MKPRAIYITSLFLCLTYLSGCTVLGAAADIAIIEATQDKESSKERAEPIFMKEGLAQDAKIVAAIFGPIVDAVKSNKSTRQAAKQASSRRVYQCPHELDSNGKCYSDEYYEKLYNQLHEYGASSEEDG